MRNLTIRRAKNFAASLARMKVYLEDAVSGELVINGKPCRKLGELKNGEEKTFPIGDNAATVFVIAGKASKSYCNDFFEIPAGTEDILLSGKNEFNPATGNAFRFDGVQHEQVIQNRKKASIRGWIILIVVVFAVAIVSYLLRGLMDRDKEKTFSSDGLTITMSDEFSQSKTTMPDVTVYFESDSALVLATKESFSDAPELADWTLTEYGEALIEINDYDGVSLERDGGLTYFEYVLPGEDLDDGTYFFTAVYKTSDAFWSIQFLTPEINRSHYSDRFCDWAKSAEFETSVV